MSWKKRELFIFIYIALAGVILSYLYELYELLKNYNSFPQWNIIFDLLRYHRNFKLILKIFIVIYVFYVAARIFVYRKIKKGMIRDQKRFWYSFAYFITAILIVVIFKERLFHSNLIGIRYNSPRFFWCVACSFFGFSTYVFRLCLNNPEPDSSPFPSYITNYPFILIAISCISFSVFSGFKSTQGYIFYYASFALCFTLGALVDEYWNIVKTILVKIFRHQ